MITEELIIFQPTTIEQAEALKQFAKAFKLKFKISKKLNAEDSVLIDLNDAVEELNSIKSGKTQARNLNELLNEL